MNEVQLNLHKNYPMSNQKTIIPLTPGHQSRRESLLTTQSNAEETIQPSIYVESSKRSESKPKNLLKLTIILLVISLSSFYFGYSLTYLSTIPQNTLYIFYGQIIMKTSTLPVLTGAMPLGAIAGSLLASIVMRYFTRRNFLVFVNIFALIINILIQITNIWVLFFCRLINGILVGLYLGLVPSYIKQLCPHSVSGTFGTFTQSQHLFGCVASYFVGMIFYLCGSQGEFFMRFQFQFTTILIILQMALIFVGYIPESPNSLLLNNKIEQAKNVLRMFNQQEEVQFIIMQKLQQNDQVDINISQLNKEKLEQAERKRATYIDTKSKKLDTVQMNWKSYFLSFQIPITQQLTGTNFIVTEMTAITALYDQNLSHYSALISNAIQFIATALSAYVYTRLGRRPIILIGNSSLGIVNIITGFAFLGFNVFNWSPGFPIGITFIMIFNIFYGLFFGPAVWLYIAQIAKKRIVPLATSMYWVGCSFCVIVPPIITSIMQSPYLSFLILGAWQIVFFIPNYFLVVETKGLSAVQISKKFKGQQ